MGRGRFLGAACFLLVTLGLLFPASATATTFDFLAPGTAYTCTTYAGHANYFAGRVSAQYTIDVEMPEGTPVYAPEAGTVEQVSSGWGGGYGNSIVWASADGRERIHIAHLRDVEQRFAPVPGSKRSRAVAVRAGDLIGHVGHTGDCDPPDFSHMHMSRSWDGSVAPLVLSGRVVDPWRGTLVVAVGPDRPFSRPESALVALEDPIDAASSGPGAPLLASASSLLGTPVVAAAGPTSTGGGGSLAGGYWLPLAPVAPAAAGLSRLGVHGEACTACAPWWASYWCLAPPDR